MNIFPQIATKLFESSFALQERLEELDSPRITKAVELIPYVALGIIGYVGVNYYNGTYLVGSPITLFAPSLRAALLGVSLPLYTFVLSGKVESLTGDREHTKVRKVKPLPPHTPSKIRWQNQRQLTEIQIIDRVQVTTKEIIETMHREAQAREERDKEFPEKVKNYEIFQKNIEKIVENANITWNKHYN